MLLLAVAHGAELLVEVHVAPPAYLAGADLADAGQLGFGEGAAGRHGGLVVSG